MNDKFNNVGKRLPYHERDEYIDELIDRSVQRALDRPQVPRVNHLGRKRMIWASIAAIALFAIGIQVMLNYHDPQQPQAVMADEAPIDQFLNSISDEEAAQLQCFEIEEIPEY